MTSVWDAPGCSAKLRALTTASFNTFQVIKKRTVCVVDKHANGKKMNWKRKTNERDSPKADKLEQRTNSNKMKFNADKNVTAANQHSSHPHHVCVPGNPQHRRRRGTGLSGSVRGTREHSRRLSAAFPEHGVTVTRLRKGERSYFVPALRPGRPQ